ncbi:acyltransferase [Candidatus Marithrix sp. Canyon 246]|uniref:acyltransferase n=1 Tax=Candidatus Marithrix sp. Canyon 246 TaxID=1827136 RepID=UPI000849F05D|nr:acyltransferase [Candidatus Marithrix sp. Canyon 246]
MINRLKKYLLKRRLGISKKNIDITANSTFGNYENIIWHDNIYIDPMAYIWAVGGLEICENVIIGPRVTIHTSNHRYEDATMLPYDGYSYKKKVTIEKNVWIGDGTFIVPGVTIGEGSIVAMGSVVTKDVPKYSLVGGNPARVIKERNIKKYKELDKKERHYMKLRK